jgi:hypothetical protein
LKILKKTTNWLVDGTFKSCTLGFYQLFTIHGHTYGKSFPLMYCLLSDKTKQSYRKIFSYLKEKEIIPKFICLDLEMAVISASLDVFQFSKNVGYSFHFGQCLWRKIQNLKLTNLYKNNQKVRSTLRISFNLALVPPEDVYKCFKELSNKIKVEKDGKLTNS